MKAYRDELPIRDERRGAYVVVAVAGAVFVVLLLLYFGLREPAEDAPQQAVIDPAVAVPAVVGANAAASATPEPAQDAAEFNERQLDPPRPVVSAGEAPVAPESENFEVFVIAGDLLEEIEEDAEEE